MQANQQLKTVVALLLECAYGRAIYSLAGRTPPRHACVQVVLRESAFNPLSPHQHLQHRDETLFVAFQQRLAFHVRDAIHTCLSDCPVEGGREQETACVCVCARVRVRECARVCARI